MSLLSLLAGGLPTPVFNADALGVATLVHHLDAGVTTELAVPVSIMETDAGPVFRISVASDHHVELTLQQLLTFAREVSGIDLQALMGQVGALLG